MQSFALRRPASPSITPAASLFLFDLFLYFFVLKGASWSGNSSRPARGVEQRVFGVVVLPLLAPVLGSGAG